MAAASYMKNLAKSIGYSTIEVIKEYNPAITAFSQNNSEVMKSAYTAITHMDKTISDVSSTILDSKAGQVGKVALKNIKEDLHSGKWYNMERKNKADEAAAASFMGLDEFGGDDFGFEDMANGDFGFEDNEGSLEDMVDLVGKKSSQAVSEAIVQTTEHSINVQTQLARASAEQDRAIYANLHAAMDTINQNLAKMIEIANGPLTTHMENSQKFYEAETKLSEERNSILKEMLELQKGVYGKKDKNYSKSGNIGMSQLLDEYGMLDLEQYFERIKQNINDMSGGTGDLIKELLENGSLEAMVASPLEFLTTNLVRTVIPTTLKKAMTGFNETLSGAFTSIMNQVMHSDNDNSIFNALKSIFGVDERVKTSINAGNYEKGAVPFDGIVRKSIIEVIPAYLARIEAAVSNKTERRFDYDKGKFINIDEIKKSFDEIEKGYRDSANRDALEYVNKFLKNIDFGDDGEREKQLRENIDKVLKQSFINGRIVDMKDPLLGPDSFGFSGDHTHNDFEFIKQMFKSIPRNVMMRYAENAYRARSGITRTMEDMEMSGHNVANALFNDSLGKDYGKESKTEEKKEETLAAAVEDKKPAQEVAKEDKKKEQEQEDKKESKVADKLAGAAKNVAETAKNIAGALGGLFKRKNKKDNTVNDQTLSAAINIDPTANVADKANDKTSSQTKSEKADTKGKAADTSSKANDKENHTHASSQIGGSLEDEEAAQDKKKEEDKYKLGTEKRKTVVESFKEQFGNKEKEEEKKVEKVLFDDDDIETVAEQAAAAYLVMDEEEDKSIFAKIQKSQKVGEGVKGLVKGIQTLINKPTDFLAGIIKKADEAIYTMIFGTEYDEETGEKKSIAAVIFDGLKKEFQNFSDWMSKTFEPITKYFNKEGTLGNKIKTFIDTKILKKAGESELATRMGDEASNILKGTGKIVTDTASSVVNAAGESAASDKTQFSDLIDLEGKLKGTGETEEETSNAASGMRKVKKTGLVAVSEGEMIVPPDMNPYNIDKRKKNENRAKKNFVADLISHIPGFAEGARNIGNEPSPTPSGVDAMQAARANKWISIFSGDIGSAIAQFKSLPEQEKKKVLESLRKNKQEEILKIIREAKNSNVAKGIQAKAADIKNNVMDAVNRGLGKDDKSEEKEKEMTKEQESMIKTAFKELDKYFPEVAIGGLLGSGVSFVTGAIGGPLLGAAVGAGISLLKHSETINEMLFGKIGEDGKREGNLLSKELSEKFQKYAPAMGKGAIMGAITSILPFVPGGPVSGAILGSAIGFATQSDWVKNQLFGDDGLFEKDFPEKVKKALPALGLGAAAGVIAGPFGLVPNMLIGAMGGLATTTNTFKDIMFGEEGKDGKRHGGVLEGAIHGIFKPITDFTKDTIGDLTEWAKENIKQPLMDAIDPLKKQIQLIFRGIHEGINSLFKDALGATMDDMLRDYIFKPVGGFVKKTIGLAMYPVKMIVSAPFKFIGAVGDGLRNHQIKKGNADYMTAEQRLAFREKRGKIGNLNVTPGARRWNKLDESMAALTGEQAKDLASNLSMVLDTESTMDKFNEDAYKKFTKNVRKNKNLSAQDVNKIAKQIKKYMSGSKSLRDASKKIHKYIHRLDIPESDKNELVKATNDYLANVDEARFRRQQFGGNKRKMIDTLQEALNADIDEKDLPKLLKNLQSEANAKAVGEDEEESDVNELDKHQDERHKDIVERLKEINQTLINIRDKGKEEDAEAIEKQSEQLQSMFKSDSDAADRFDATVEGVKDGAIDAVSSVADAVLHNRVTNALNKGRRYLVGDHRVDWRNAGKNNDEDESDEQQAGLNDAVSNAPAPTDSPKGENVHVEFSGGRQYRYIDEGNGRYHLDRADGATVASLQADEEDRQQQQGFFKTMMGIPGSLFDGIKKAFNGDEDDKENKKGILGKIFSIFGGGKDSASGLIGKGIAAAIGIPLLTGMLKKFLGETEIGQTLSSKLGDLVSNLGLKEKFQSVVDGIVGWLRGDEGSFGGGLPGLIAGAMTHWATGFEFICSNIIPKAAEIIIASLPSMLLGVAKGLGSLMGINFYNALHGGQKAKDLLQPDKDIDASVGSIKITGIRSMNGDHKLTFGGKTFGTDSWSSVVNGDYSTKPIATNFDTLVGGGIHLDTVEQVASGALDEEGNNIAKTTNDSYDYKLKEGLVGDYRKTEAYLSLGETARKKLDDQLAEMEANGENVFQINMGTAENPDWRYVTLQEILANKDTEIMQYIDENGNTKSLTGTDILNNPTLGKSFNLDWQLTDEERQKNKEELGLAKNDSLGKTLLVQGAKTFIKGNNLAHGALNIASKVAGKVPVAGKPLQWGMKGANKVLDFAADLKSGSVKAPSFLSKLKNGLHGADDIVEILPNDAMDWVKTTRADAVSKIKAGDAFDLIEETGEKKSLLSRIGSKFNISKVGSEYIDDAAENAMEGAAKKASKEGKDGIIKTIVNWTKDHIKDIAKNNTIFNKVGDALKKAGKKCGKEAVEAAINKIIDVIEKKAMPKFVKSIAKCSTKFLGKIAAKIASGGLIGLIMGGAAFISAFNNAESILGVIDDNDLVDYDPSFGVKLACGLASFLNETLLNGILPVDTIFEILYPICKTLFNIDTAELDAAREKSQEVLTQYNMDNETNLSIEEYNDKDKWTTKAKNGIANFFMGEKDKETGKREGGLFNNIANAAGNAWDAMTQANQAQVEAQQKTAEAQQQAMGSLWGGIKDFGSKLWGGMQNGVQAQTEAQQANMEAQQQVTGSIWDGIKGFGSNLWNGIQNATKTQAEAGMANMEAQQQATDSLLNGMQNASKIATETQVANAEAQSKAIDMAVDGIKNIGKSLSDTANNIGAAMSEIDIGELLKSGVKSGWDYAIYKSKNNAVDTLNKKYKDNMLSGVIKFFGAIVDEVMSPVRGITTIGKALQDVFGKVTKKVKSTLNKTANVPKVAMKDITSKKLKPGEFIKGSANNSAFGKGQKAVDDPIPWIPSTVDKIVRTVLSPVAVISSAGNDVAETITGFIDDGKKCLTNLAKELLRIDKYREKESLDGYWDDKTKTSSGFFGVIENIVGSIVRFVMFPYMLIRQAVNKIANMIKDPTKWIKEKLGPLGEAIEGFFGSGTGKATSATNGTTGRKAANIIGNALNNTPFSGRGSNLQAKSDPKYADDPSFVSQIDKRYASNSFNVSGDSEKQTIADTGCGPAAAAMVVNNAYQNQEALDMKQASKDALKYKVKDGGVNAAYFEDEFTKHGLATNYIMDDDPRVRNQNILNNLRSGNRTVLMGRDPFNDSKANSPYGPNDHYIVATRASDDGKYVWVNDPESKNPEIKYPTSAVLNNTKMGVSGMAASGSRLLKSIHARGTSATTKVKNRLKALHGRGAYGPDTIQYKVWNLLRAGGLNEFQTAGVMGNIEAESAFDLNAIEKGNGIGFGLCQWSFGRRAQIESYASSIGKSAGDLEVQIAFLLAELNPSGGCNGYANYQLSPKTFEGKRWGEDTWRANDVESTTKTFCYCWERPSSANGSAMEKRLNAAKKYFEEFTGTPVAGISSSTDSSSSGGSILDKIFGVFGDLAAAFGLSTGSSSDESTGTGVVGGSTQQIALVNQMKSIEGKLGYAQNNAAFPGPRDAEGGISSDCSETVQWAYKKVLGVDPGTNTWAQETDPDMYTVTTKFDESQMQPGDLLMYNGHVEMYAGDGQMIGHGGGPGGKTPGPTMKKLSDLGRFRMVRRWVGFKDMENEDNASTTGTQTQNSIFGKTTSTSTINANIVNANSVKMRASARGSGLDPDEEISIDDTSRSSNVSHTNKRGFLKKSRYNNFLKKNVKIPAGYYAAGSDLDDTIDTIINSKAPGTDYTPAPKVVSIDTSSSDINAKVSAYLAAILKLLSKEVENTSMLSTIVAILTELVQITEEERSLNGKSGNDIEQKRTALENKRLSMLNVLKATGIQNNSGDELTKLMRDAERLAKL